MSEFNFSEYFKNIINIGLAFSAEKDINKLLNKILYEVRVITNCDAGTLYLKEKDQLVFCVMHNETLNTFQGSAGEVIQIPPVVLDPDNMENVSAYVALTGKIVNIKDVYENVEFNFEGPRKYDAITGYRSQSMIVFPLANVDGDIIGVMQLLNAKDTKTNEVIPFSTELEGILKSLASYAAVALSNLHYTKELKDLLDSFVMMIAIAIDERSKYNANHTRNVAKNTEKFISYINKCYENNSSELFFNDLQKEQIIMSAWLHDIGKLVTSLEIMDKSTRLGTKLETVLQRFTIFKQRILIEYLLNNMTEEEKERELNDIQELTDLIETINHVDFLTEDKLEALHSYKDICFLDENGNRIKALSEEEYICLSVRTGTLTNEERKVMQDHVLVTKKLLDRILFSKNFKNVPIWAAGHHEFIDGTGYPEKLSGDEVSIEMRILTVMDIFDALTAWDRPYKDGMPIEKALSILNEMVNEGKLDGSIVKLLENSKLWEE